MHFTYMIRFRNLKPLSRPGRKISLAVKCPKSSDSSSLKGYMFLILPFSCSSGTQPTMSFELVFLKCPWHLEAMFPYSNSVLHLDIPYSRRVQLRFEGHQQVMLLEIP